VFGSIFQSADSFGAAAGGSGCGPFFFLTPAQLCGSIAGTERNAGRGLTEGRDHEKGEQHAITSCGLDPSAAKSVPRYP
jgi:hypothetical protein